MKKQIKSGLVLVLALVVAGVSTVQAATTQSSVPNGPNNGLKVSPVRLDLVIQPGTTRTVDVVVQNVTTQPTALRGIVNDFVANSNETGQPDIILDENQFAATHSLKRLVGALPTVNLQPNEQKIVKVNITIPQNTAAGGYYGTVRFVSANSDNDNNVLLLPSVGSLILVRVPGDLRESLNVASLDIRKEDTAHKLFTTPEDLKAVIRFRNDGNVQVEPFGKLTVRDHRNKVISDTEINNTDPRGSVLPDSVRRFDVALNDLGKLGKYTVEGNFGYGTTGQLISVKTTFYVVPLPLILLAGAILLFIILAIIFVPKAVRAYNRRILRNARYRK